MNKYQNKLLEWLKCNDNSCGVIYSMHKDEQIPLVIRDCLLSISNREEFEVLLEFGKWGLKHEQKASN